MTVHNILFKFVTNSSSLVFTKNLSHLSRILTKTALNVDYNQMKNLKQGQLSQCYFNVNSKTFCNFNENSNSLENNEEKRNCESESLVKAEYNIISPVSKGKRNVLEPASNNVVNFVAPHVKPTFNLAAYADNSDVLKHLIKLGVEIGRWDKDKEICANILNKDLENDIKPYIFFLHDNGITVDKLGYVITKNPHIFEHSLENLQVRINYLESRKFTKQNILTILNKAPNWLNYSAIAVDRELGNLKKRFNLSSEEVIFCATRDPRLIIYIIETPFLIERHSRVLHGQCGFTNKELKSMLLGYPRIYRTNLDCLLRRFDVIRGEMNLSHEVIASSPEILRLRERKIQERHRFLKFLKRDQYNPAKPGYVSIRKFISGSDAEFSTNVALASTEIYNDFLKTM